MIGVRFRTPRLLQPLRHRDFRLWWAGQTVSNLGNFVYQIAAPFQVLELGGSAAQIGLTVGILFAVRVVMLLFGGAVVDRVPKRPVLLMVDLVNGGVVTILWFLGATGILLVEHLYVASLVFGITSSFWVPAARSIIPELVPDEILTQGNALRALSHQIGRLAGPVLGGAIVVALGAPAGFLVDGATFFFSFACFAAASSVAPSHGTSPSLLRAVRSGIRYTFSIPWLWSSILLFALINACLFAPLMVGLPVLVRDVLRADARLFGVLSAAIGVGEITGTILVGQARIARLGVGCYMACALASAGVAGLGLLPFAPVMFVFGALQGHGVVVANALWNTALQRNVPREMLGRVSSVDDLGGILLAPVAPVGVGVLIEGNGAPVVFAVAGILGIALSLAGLRLPGVRELQ